MRSGGLCLKPFQHYPRVFRSFLDADAKRKIERAATFAQRSVSSFVLASALASAEKIIGDHETLTLSDQDRDRLFAALLDPPPPNRALRSAFADHSNEVVAHGDA